MKTDLYTKTVLTIIAACLVMLVLRPLSLMPTAVAATPAGARTYGLMPVNTDGSVTVRMQTGQIMPVNIVSVRKPGNNNGLPTDRAWDAINTTK